MLIKNLEECKLRLILPKDLFLLEIPHTRWDMHLQDELAIWGIALAQLFLEPLELILLCLIVGGIFRVHKD